MVDELEFSISMAGIPKGRPRLGRGHVYTPARTVNFEKAVAMVTKIEMAKAGFNIVVGLCRVSLTFDFKRPKKTVLLLPKPDVDNLAKSVLDGMNGVAFVDDTLVADLSSCKYWSDKDLITVKISRY